jgi:hypothetical protein
MEAERRFPTRIKLGATGQSAGSKAKFRNGCSKGSTAVDLATVARRVESPSARRARCFAMAAKCATIAFMKQTREVS